MKNETMAIRQRATAII